MSALRTFLETHELATATPRPAVSRTAGRHDLAVLFRNMRYAHGAEIGVWRGDFAAYLCQTIPGLRLTCVDPWAAYGDYRDPKNDQATLEAAYAHAREQLEPWGCDLKRTTSEQAAQTVPDGSLDFVYLDGNHGEAFVRADLEAWTPKVRVGGIVAGHDYELKPRHAHLQVKAAVDAFARARGIDPVYVLAHDKSPSFFWLVPS